MTHPPIRSFTNFDPPFDMILVEGGTFSMGMEKGDPDSLGVEQPVHKVTMPDFYLGKFPVTQALWKTVMEEEPSYFAGQQRPVEQVSWHDAQKFIEKIRAVTGQNFRLPTEAEWEFSAQGGVFGTGLKYAGSNRLKELAWYSENSHGESKIIGQKVRNELGLYDMNGNVWEWCEDDWNGDYKKAPDDGSAWVDVPERGTHRVFRGGGWNYSSRSCRTAGRSHWRSGDRGYLGFRLALSLQSVG